MALPKALSLAGEAIKNTGRGERVFYAVLLIAGVVFLIFGLLVESQEWATSHPYIIGLLDGVTGFCFGVPVAGVVIRDITRRASQAAERTTIIRAVTGQLDYLDRLVQGLSQGPIQSAGERIRSLAESARWAAPRASVIVKGGQSSLRFWVVDVGGGALAGQPKLDKVVAEKLRPFIESEKLWASLGFGCSRLGSDVTRLVSILYSSSPSQAFPGWFDELTGALQTLLVIQLPAHRRWLPAAVKDPPATVPIAVWSLKSDSPEGNVKLGIVSLKSTTSNATEDTLTTEVMNAAQERATNELTNELFALAHHLDALAALATAVSRCRSALGGLPSALE